MDSQAAFELYKTVFDLSSEVIFITSLQGDILTCNKTALQTFGYDTFDEISRKKVYDLYAETDSLTSIVDQLTLNGIYNYDNISLLKKDGNAVYCSGTAVMHNGPGNTSCIIITLTDITQSLEMESALAESEERYREIVENINDVIYTLDDQGLITYISPVVEQISGYRVADLLGHHFLELIHPDDVPELLQSYDRTLKGEIAPFHFRIMDKDGSTRYARSSSRIIEHDGKITGLRSILTDMSEKKESDEKLRFQAMLLDQIQDQITATDISGSITYINEAGMKVLDKTREEIIGSKIYTFGDNPEQGATQKEIIGTTLLKGSWRGTVVDYDSSGNDKILETRTWLIRDSGGSPTGMVGVSTDVTSLMKTTEALVLSEKKYRNLIDTINIAIFVTRNGKIFYINPYTSIISGFSEEELINMSFTDFIHPDDRSIIKERHLSRMKNEIVSERFPFRIIDRSGNTRWMEISAISTEWDNVPSVLNFMIDITERIMAEGQMRMAKERAEEADRLKSAFLANISHELRTPINAINGSIDLLLDDDSGADISEYINIIKHSSALLLHLIEDTLDLSKIESDQIFLENIPFNLADIIRQVNMNTRLFINQNKKDITFTSFTDDGISEHITGDSVRLQQVLNNLLNNAVKFTESGAVELRVSLTDKNMLSFTISDTGIGIAPDKQISIFDRFQQVDHSFRRKHSGAGLGLTISKSLVELMQGTIYFESDTGTDHGSIFTITIPYRPSDKQSESVNKTSEKTVSKDLYTILLVEDNSINLLLTSRILEKEGYNIITAVNGMEAVKHYISGIPIDLVLMDIQMPVMDGLEATAAIRRFELEEGGTAHVPVVVLTAHATKDDRERVIDAGCDDYITKPIERGNLLKKLSEYLSPS